MKKIFTILSLTCIVSLSSNAQCAGGVSVCNPDPTTPSATFKPTPANLACAVKGTAYNESISFKIPASVTQPQAVDLDSVQIVSMSNLPCGLCYSFSKASKRYNANEVGCFTISGTTNDAVGQYTVDIQMLAWLKGATLPQGPVSTQLANLDFFIRVATSTASCTPLNVNDPGLTAACGVGINEVAKDIHAVAIVPNPMHSSATLNFESDNAGVYTVNIVNVLGNVVSSKEVKVATGSNQVVIERNTLTEGVYFVQIANGKSTATTKFVIAD
ncbi:MAG: T9SS type A sorting domain-containing protein [Chitinophagales bacterium]